jgi:hypothetical protein
LVIIHFAFVADVSDRIVFEGFSSVGVSLGRLNTDYFWIEIDIFALGQALSLFDIQFLLRLKCLFFRSIFSGLVVAIPVKLYEAFHLSLYGFLTGKIQDEGYRD